MMKMSRGVPVGLSILSLYMFALFLVFLLSSVFVMMDWTGLFFSSVVPLIALKVFYLVMHG